MTTEEKAKAYDEALTIAKRIISKNCSEVEKLCLKSIFPELTESEDERTKKQLIDAIKIGCSNSGISFTKEAADRYIAWLEKQEENTWSEEDDAKVKVMCEEGYLKPSERAWLKDLKNRVWKEQKPAEWSAKGRRGRIGSTPEHIRKKAENFLSKMEPPYDADDICSAYETGAMENANSSWSEEDERKYQCIRRILLADMDKKIGSWKYSEILEWYEKIGIDRYTNFKNPHPKSAKAYQDLQTLYKNIKYGN